MIKRISYITGKEYKKIESNMITPSGESKTDKSQFRPDIASVRDKAIALQKAGAGREGLYDIDENSKIDENTLQNIAYARNSKRDIAEIQIAKETVERRIEQAKEADKENLKSKAESNIFKRTIQKLVENTNNLQKGGETDDGRKH